MSSIKTQKSKCIVIERYILECKNLSFDDLGLLVRIIGYEAEKLNVEEFSLKYDIPIPTLCDRLSDLEKKGFIISRDKS
jgi:hypothetical protein